MKNEILYFIEKFRQGGQARKFIVDLFFNDYSYYFAKILEARFAEETKITIMYDTATHQFACLIDGVIYDILGDEPMSENYYIWEDYQRDYPREAEMVKQTCIKKSLLN